MSYCRFENTLDDLRDCFEHFRTEEELSEKETKKRKALFKLCKRIVEDYEPEYEEAI